MLVYRYIFIAHLMVVFTSLFPMAGHTQTVDVSIEPKQIMMGQHATLEVVIQIQAGSTLVWPAVVDTLTSDIEIIRFGRPDTISREGGMISLRQRHLITAWEEGFKPVPPMTFTGIVEQDTIVMETRALLLEVKGVELDPDADIRDIKNIFGIPLAFRDLLPWLGGLLFLVIAGWLLYKFLRRSKKREMMPTIWEKPDIPAHIAALSGLEQLKSRKLWQQGKVKLYHSELTDIMRMYLYRRYGIHAPEMTTSEILQLTPSRIQNDQARMEIKEILELADLVKFAKYMPGASENEASLDLAFGFVGKTKQEVKDAE